MLEILKLIFATDIDLNAFVDKNRIELKQIDHYENQYDSYSLHSFGEVVVTKLYVFYHPNGEFRELVIMEKNEKFEDLKHLLSV